MGCTFCGSPRFWGRKVRSHSALYLVDQMERLARKGVSFFYVSDDTFTLDRARVLEACREILRRRLPVTWAAISHVTLVDEEVLYWMRRAGCIQISYGVEHGSAAIRKALNKNLPEAAIRKAFSLTVRYGILARAYFIYGCPGETGKEVEETLALLDELRPLSAIFYILDIFPGTALYDAFRRRTGAGDEIWLQRIEDILYYETDPALDAEQVTAHGRRLREEFYRRLPAYAASVALVDRKELYPFHADFLSRLAMTFDQGDYAGVEAIPDKEATAEALYRRALTYHPDARAYLGLGILAQRRRDDNAALEILEEGARRCPGDGHIPVALAVSYLNQGRFREAATLLEPFARRPDALPFLAAAYRGMGENEKADAAEAALERHRGPFPL
jgi:hypothetical protein